MGSKLAVLAAAPAAAGAIPTVFTTAVNPSSPNSAVQHPVVDDLMLRLPVLEEPCALGGLVEVAGPKYVPQGYRLAPDVPPAADDPKC